MRKITKVVLTLFVLIFYSKFGLAQVSVSYYNSITLSKIGLGYNFSPKIWSEMRLYSNNFFDYLTPELVTCYNISSKEKHTVYAGLGGVINIFEGIVVPVGVQFSPFEKLDHFSFHIEIQPTFDRKYKSFIQSNWGLRYKFGK